VLERQSQVVEPPGLSTRPAKHSERRSAVVEPRSLERRSAW